jgi:ribosomal protein S18 acetylase RimI-like enzyme
MHDAINHAIRLCAATPDDEPFLIELRECTMTEHLERMGEPTDAESHRLRMRSNFDIAQIICCDGRRIGLLKVVRAGSVWRIQQIQVLPAWQGRGIGAGVIRAVLAQAHQAGVAVTLSVLRGNPALRLYERLGFRVTTETPIELKLTCHP